MCQNLIILARLGDPRTRPDLGTVLPLVLRCRLSFVLIPAALRGSDVLKPDDFGTAGRPAHWARFRRRSSPGPPLLQRSFSTLALLFFDCGVDGAKEFYASPHVSRG